MAETDRATLLAGIARDHEAMALAMVAHRLQQIFAVRLTAGQLHALIVLDTVGPQPASELARMLAISGATATGLVDRLVRDGLAQRRADPHDGRSRVVHVTEAGVAAWRSALLGPSSIDADVLTRLTDEELEQLGGGIAAVRRAIAEVTATRDNPGPAVRAEGP